MLVKGITGHYKPDKMLPDYKVIPDREIIGWRGACECGWRGELWERVRSPADADFSHRRDYRSPDDFAPDYSEIENAIHDEWKSHLAPLDAVEGIEATVREYKQARHRLDKTVASAKSGGASWADIGRAVGISRQSAHERWADKE